MLWPNHFYLNRVNFPNVLIPVIDLVGMRTCASLYCLGRRIHILLQVCFSFEVGLILNDKLTQTLTVTYHCWRNTELIDRLYLIYLIFFTCNFQGTTIEDIRTWGKDLEESLKKQQLTFSWEEIYVENLHQFQRGQ